MDVNSIAVATCYRYWNNNQYWSNRKYIIRFRYILDIMLVCYIATMFSYRHIWDPSNVVYIHEDNDQSHCHTHHLLCTDHTGWYSCCRSGVGNKLYIKKQKKTRTILRICQNYVPFLYDIAHIFSDFAIHFSTKRCRNSFYYYANLYIHNLKELLEKYS